jgi:ABC-2 type transport system permease protein
MSLKIIWGIILQEIFITRRSLEVIMDIIFFPSMNVLLFGFISAFVASGGRPITGQLLLMGIVLWEIVYITQYSISVGSLWSIWSRNLTNIFITPIRVSEYLLAHFISGVLKAFLMIVIFTLLVNVVFHFDMMQLGIVNLFLYFVNLVLFATSTGILILGVIFRYGTRLSALAWGLIFIIQPLTAALFPLSVLPYLLQKVALLLPVTYIFEAARQSVFTHQILWKYIGIATAENIIYLIVSLALFGLMFNKAKNTGQFARNEG